MRRNTIVKPNTTSRSEKPGWRHNHFKHDIIRKTNHAHTSGYNMPVTDCDLRKISMAGQTTNDIRPRPPPQKKKKKRKKEIIQV